MGGGVEGMVRGSADAGACGECADAVSCSRYMEVRVLERTGAYGGYDLVLPGSRGVSSSWCSTRISLADATEQNA